MVLRGQNQGRCSSSLCLYRESRFTSANIDYGRPLTSIIDKQTRTESISETY